VCVLSIYVCVLMLKGGTGEAKPESYRGHAAVTLLDPHCRYHCRHQYFCHHISTEMFCSTECIASRCTSCPLNSFLFVLTFVVKFACCVLLVAASYNYTGYCCSV